MMKKELMGSCAVCLDMGAKLALEARDRADIYTEFNSRTLTSKYNQNLNIVAHKPYKWSLHEKICRFCGRVEKPIIGGCGLKT
jgi:hypothetical protein